MAFSTFDFLFVFLPIFLVLYYMVPAKQRSLLLFAGSAVFYIYGTLTSPVSILLLFGLTVLTFFTGIAMAREDGKDPLLIGVVTVLMFGILLFFKYNGFFLGKGAFALPLGISFYTFSMSSYLFDVYRGKLEAERSFVRYAAYVMMFPKLLSGPIAVYGDIGGDMRQAELRESCIRFRNVDSGMRTFLYGLGMKVLVADRLSGLWHEVGGIGYDSLSVPMAWLGVLAFSLRLYFDFWGYSLMAMGVGEMMGYRLPVNFKHPYASKTMTDFWRRWHVTLGAWFRDYIYIPLGGSRCSKGRMFFNMGLVWLATGLWHGSTVNFLLWAGFLFLVICLEKLLYGKYLEQTRVVGHIYMVPLILFSWLLFAVTDVNQLWTYIVQLFSFGEKGVNPMDYVEALKNYGGYLAAGIVLSVPAVHRVWEEKIRDCWLGTVILIGVFGVCLYSIAMGQNDPFMYFGF